MAIRTALLNGNNISRDTDFSKYIETVSEAGVIEGLEVTASKVGIGKARVPCERTNGETIYALVYNSSEVSISGNGDVYIQVSQTYIDDGELANEDGTGIATIQVGTMPSKNALKLATISSGTPTDARNMIPKVGELNTQIESIFDSLEDLDERVEKLEEAGAIDHLEESGLVGELYTLSDTLFKQNTPTLADSTLDCNVSDVAANTQIHIQRIASGVASNQLKLKVKMVGESTQNLKVEVRKGVQVTVTEGAEAYWYGNQVVASGSIPYSEISTDYAEKTITLDNEFGGNKGELLDVVVYMDTVNASNYYCVACDSTQYSEGFSYVSVNGSTRTRSKLMPYCLSDGFAQSLLVKAKDGFELLYHKDYIVSSGGSNTKTGYILSSPNYTIGIYKLVYDLTVSEISSGATTFGQVKLANSTNTSTLSFQEAYTVPITGLGKFHVEKIVNADSVPSNQAIAYYVDAFSKMKLEVENLKFYKKLYNWEVVSINLKPYEVAELGKFTTVLLYGIDNDGEYYGGIMLSKETSATTGSITLGNAVGYIKVNLNGEIVKIPYYGN